MCKLINADWSAFHIPYLYDCPCPERNFVNIIHTNEQKSVWWVLWVKRHSLVFIPSYFPCRDKKSPKWKKNLMFALYINDWCIQLVSLQSITVLELFLCAKIWNDVILIGTYYILWKNEFLLFFYLRGSNSSQVATTTI